MKILEEGGIGWEAGTQWKKCRGNKDEKKKKTEEWDKSVEDRF